MNLALQLLNDARQQITLEHGPLPQALTSLVLTPRFQASSHVIYLVLAQGSPDPLLVVKVPRLAGSSASITREANNLRRVQAGGRLAQNAAPRLVTHSFYANREILVETALTGQAMSPAVVRREPARCCALTVRWLLDLAGATRCESADQPDWYERLVQQPLAQMAGLGLDSARLAAATREKTAALGGMALPLVFEHGDLSHPNILLLKQGGIGVVDWEQAEPEGLPLTDLVFFLTYASTAQRQARTHADFIAAFRAAFFGKPAWAAPYLQDYAGQLQLPPEALAPLLLLTWPRYLAALLARLSAADSAASADAAQDQPAGEWLRANRFYALWQYTLDHFDELGL